jgi:hypothetical protein
MTGTTKKLSGSVGVSLLVDSLATSLCNLYIGTRLLRQLQNAVRGRSDHVPDFFEFSDSLPAQTVLGWSEMVERWENNNQETNPFVITAPSA